MTPPDDGLQQNPAILLVDDDVLLLRSLRRALGQRCRVFVANTPAQALLVLSSHEIALIVSEFEVGYSNGLVLLRHVQRLFPNVRRCLMAAAEPGGLEVMRQRGLFERFMLKGSASGGIVACIEQLLQSDSRMSS